MGSLYSFSIDDFYIYGLSEISTMTLFSIFKNDDDLFAQFNIAYDDKIYIDWAGNHFSRENINSLQATVLASDNIHKALTQVKIYDYPIRFLH